jgi:acetyl-CoA carboxylase biotin carboxylase subunit
MLPKGEKEIKRILIANRGEIAVRVIRACHDLGIEAIAVYSEADTNSLHRTMADLAVQLSGRSSSESYLNVRKVISAIKATRADAVHPGYGFLAENPAFADAVRKENVVFIGPPTRSMELMGNKIEARRLMQKHGIPVVPGCEDVDSVETLKRFADGIGFPLILKASAGGGGRGMRVVREVHELKEAYEACKREAQAYFNNPTIFAEQYLEAPRHIEFQVLFDAHGNGIHLFERDCSIQRRHQKLFEEAPSVYLDAERRQYLGELACRAARAVGYEGAGTVEFISHDPSKFYFMEMNTRIQVEHPVTEWISGVDLVAEQIRVARGEKLAFRQQDLVLRGWALEARINAEDPRRDFLPSPGTAKSIHVPSGPFVRIDTHLYPGYTIPAEYDSLLAKVIVWGQNRNQAIRRMQRSLSEFRIDGVPTTIRFHEALLENPDFREGRFGTTFLEKNARYFSEKMGTQSGIYQDKAALLAVLLKVESDSQGLVPCDDDRHRWGRQARVENAFLNTQSER